MFVPSAALHSFNFMSWGSSMQTSPAPTPPRDKVSIRPLLGARFIPTKNCNDFKKPMAFTSKGVTSWWLLPKVVINTLAVC